MIFRSSNVPNQRKTSAFTLLEILIAMGIFFMAIFAILQLVSQNLKAARLLKPMQVDASSIFAEMSLTNRFEEGPIPDDYLAHFRDMYPGYNCSGFISIPPPPEGTNGLFLVEVEISGDNKAESLVRAQALMYKPLSQQGLKGTKK